MIQYEFRAGDGEQPGSPMDIGALMKHVRAEWTEARETDTPLAGTAIEKLQSEALATGQGATNDCVPFKTAPGLAEMSRRQHGLSQRQRTMLLLVDGRRTVAQVKGVATQAGAPASCFDELLALGLISLPEPAPSIRAVPVVDTGPVPLATQTHHGDLTRMNSLSFLPASVLGDSLMSSQYPTSDSAHGELAGVERETSPDEMLVEARRILMRAVRAKAPVTGSLTLIKLRRTRTRQDLLALFDEIDSHISKPIGHLSAQQTLRHVRGLLERPM
jgi:hypothetical protein